MAGPEGAVRQSADWLTRGAALWNRLAIRICGDRGLVKGRGWHGRELLGPPSTALEFGFPVLCGVQHLGFVLGQAMASNVALS